MTIFAVTASQAIGRCHPLSVPGHRLNLRLIREAATETGGRPLLPRFDPPKISTCNAQPAAVLLGSDPARSPERPARWPELVDGNCHRATSDSVFEFRSVRTTQPDDDDDDDEVAETAEDSQSTCAHATRPGSPDRPLRRIEERRYSSADCADSPCVWRSMAVGAPEHRSVLRPSPSAAAPSCRSFAPAGRVRRRTFRFLYCRPHLHRLTEDSTEDFCLFPPHPPSQPTAAALRSVQPHGDPSHTATVSTRSPSS